MTMRLKQIKLAGFKSFVDPITVSFPANLTGVVGPNGCGKSNIIDAVRWVMGESSAKQLRGESIVDVIFNGSINRKPSGHASIELLFDNTDGSLGGMYAQYPEIVIRRQVSHEGISTYYLNGAVCRRRDITDIFLGTGLGPRSYAIIEQGMISRLIEAKPEELRIYLEEAAGISKYKERRRETELRLQHTKDNLARLNDIREELQKQLDHLSKQAAIAEKYQQLKIQEKTSRSELFALKARNYQLEITKEHETILALESQLEMQNTQWQNIATQRELKQSQQIEANDALQIVQKEFYEANTALARIEEQVQHHREQKRKLEKELIQIENEGEQLLNQQKEEEIKQSHLINQINELMPKMDEKKKALETSRLSLTEMETQFYQWQEKWDAFNLEASNHSKDAHSEKVKLEHLEKHLHQIQEKISTLTHEQEEYTQLNLPLGIETLQKEMEVLHTDIENHQYTLSSYQEKLQAQRDKNHESHQKLDQYRTALQSLRGRFASLQALQEAALGKNVEATNDWLKTYHLENYPRLAEKLQVEEGWELAVETVLSQQLEAIAIEDFSVLLPEIDLPDSPSIKLMNEITPQSLASKCTGPISVLNILTKIYRAEDLQDALTQISHLSLDASVVTRDGIWLSNGWLRVMKPDDQKDSIIVREKMLAESQKQISTLTETVETAQQTLQEDQELLRTLELERDEQHKIISDLSAKYANLNAELKVQEAALNQHQQRKAVLFKEIETLQTQKSQEEKIFKASQENSQMLIDLVEKDNTAREILQKTRDEERAKLQLEREVFASHQQELHQLSTQAEVLQTQQKGSQTLFERLSRDIQISAEKLEQLKIQSTEIAPIESQLQETLNQLLASRSSLENRVQERKETLSAIEHDLREFEKEQRNHDEERNRLRTLLEEKRLSQQSLTVRIHTITEQLQEMGLELSEISQTLSPELNEIDCEALLNKTLQKIERLGPINLAAISEHAQLSERKNYLDQQNDDLMLALNTLEDAIRKIDQETRQKFKEIYEKVNELFQQLFPRIFGGGQAFLELTGDDLLETGVNVIARPPGKRNSTIHLLSGGEKALTAIALVFAIFQLNPAPFCMLDEVDAPLDDSNVGRFCELVKEMSKNVQFIFISHNKLAIEMAEHLIGVTMNEPGVSRLVAVDVKAAMEMAEV
jgi:chromosome segregation protein